LIWENKRILQRLFSNVVGGQCCCYDLLSSREGWKFHQFHFSLHFHDYFNINWNSPLKSQSLIFNIFKLMLLPLLSILFQLVSLPPVSLKRKLPHPLLKYTWKITCVLVYLPSNWALAVKLNIFIQVGPYWTCQPESLVKRGGTTHILPSLVWWSIYS